uniref:PNPLA domain-containing protein n=1 Tax=viral metagenome TaxID=1070528 RepID=A0A6C0JNQ2_9ZZZZ
MYFFNKYIFLLFYIPLFLSFKDMYRNRLLQSKLYLKFNKNIDVQNILHIKTKRSFSENENSLFLNENEFIRDKKLISISPGGFKGFYMMGICKFIKKNYDLDNYIFSGASAGAWNSLALCLKKDIDEFQAKVLDTTLQNVNNLFDVENIAKNKILESYTTEDFDLNRLFIGVTTIEKYKTNTTIFTGFDNLEDALNCCIASSHIPLITGGFTNMYRNILSFDGGFSKYPYLNITKSVLHITPSIWEKENNKIKRGSGNIIDYANLFSKKKYNYVELVENGYNDCQKNKNYLDELFDIKNN